MAHSVFISYSSQDKKVADAVCATLEHRKIRCWIAPRDVLSGIPYAEALIDAIKGSSIMVLVFSSSSNDSPQVMREVERAVDKGIPIIPFRIENVIPSKAMEYYLSAPHWLDAITPPLEKHLGKLADTVQALLAEVEKPSDEEEEKAKTTTAPDTKAVSGGRRKGLYITAGIVVIALIIVGIILAVGGSGGDDEESGLASGPTPGETSTAATTTTTGTTTPATSPTTTTKPTTTQPTVTTTTATGSTTAPVGGSHVTEPIQSGTNIQNVFTFSGEVHWYTFDAEAGDVAYIRLTDGIRDSPMYPCLGLLDPTGMVVSEDYSNGTVHLDYRITNSGKYTIRVRDQMLNTGPYVLSFAQLSEINNLLSPGTSIQSELELLGEVHWYTFNAEAGDSVYIVLIETNPCPMYPWLGLYGPNGDLVNSSYSSSSAQIDQIIPETGKYIIQVKDNICTEGEYTLTFNMLVIN